MTFQSRNLVNTVFSFGSAYVFMKCDTNPDYLTLGYLAFIGSTLQSILKHLMTGGK